MFNWLKPKQKESESESLGAFGEQVARTEYERRGFSILDSNFFNAKGKQRGEIDFIAANGSEVRFVEVKTRTQTAGRFGTGAEAVNASKQRKLLKAVKIYLAGRPQYRSLRPQIDVCLVTMESFDRARYSVIILPNAVEDSSD